MKNLIELWIVCLFSLISLTFPVPVQADRTVKVGIYQNHPLCFTDQEGRVQGIYADILNHVAKREGWKIDYVIESWNVCSSLLDEKKIDLLCGIAYTPERAEKYLFNAEDVLIDWGQIYLPKNSSIESIIDLNGKKIATVSGGILQKGLSDTMVRFGMSCQFIEVSEPDHVLELLEKHEADAGTVLRLSGIRFLPRDAVKPSAIIFHPLHFRFAAVDTGNRAILDTIDRYLVELKKDESSIYYQSIQRWLVSDRSESALPKAIIHVMIALLGLTALFFVISILFKRELASKTRELHLRNDELKQQIAERIQTEKLLAGITETAIDSIFRKNKDFRYTYVNPAMAKLFGCQLSDLLRKTPDDLFDPESASAVYEVDRATFSGNTVNTIRTIVVDGKTQTFHTIQTPLYNENGDVYEICGIVRDITALKQAEDALKESEEKYRMLIENINIAIFTTKLDGTFVHTNTAMADLTGYDSAKEVMTVPAQNLYAHHSDREYFVEMLRENGFVKNMELIAIKKDGTPYWVLLNAVLVKDNAGQPLSIFGSAYDITYRKKSEEALQKSEEKYRTLYSKMNEGFCLHELIYDDSDNPMDYQIIDVNPSYEKITGLKKEQTIGVTASVLYQAGEPPFFDIYSEVALTGKSASFEIYFPPMDKHFLVSVFSPGKGLFATIFSDITPTKKAEASIRESEIRYRELFDNINSGVAVYDVLDNGRDFIFKDFNKAGERIDNDDRERLIGKSIFEVRPGVVEFGLTEVFQRVWKTGKPENFPIMTYRDERITGWYENFVYRLPTGEIVAVFDNVTEKKQADEKIRLLNQELIEKNKELEQIVYVASHDLRSPLVNIQGFSKELQLSFNDILEDISVNDTVFSIREKIDSYLKKDIEDFFDFIFKSTAKMDTLLSGLLRLSRLGRAALTLKPINMNKMISDVIKTFEYRIKEYGTDIRYDDLPDCVGDEMMVNQVFSNLIDNALKFWDADRTSVIRIYGFAKTDESVYCVEDNGIGIAPEYQNKIFDIFHRLNPKIGGEGLGLTIIRKIAEKHHGKIWIASEAGKGSKFYLSIQNK